MDRRTFLNTLGVSALTAPMAAEAQQAANVPRIGVLVFGHPPESNRFDPNAGFREGLLNLGYVEGRNVVVEWRYAETQSDRLAKLAADLVRLNVKVIFAGGPVVLEAAM